MSNVYPWTEKNMTVIYWKQKFHQEDCVGLYCNLIQGCVDIYVEG